jgi:CHAT domain-containing protein/tetratricopeptide (TPR) repeat protein
MHVMALISLIHNPRAGKILDQSISSLQTAARLSEQPAPVLADLAGALLVRAEHAGTPRDLLAALEAAEQAREREPHNRAALFNRALALQRFGLAEVAADAWRGYLATDSTSGWADEARWKLRGALAGFEPAAPEPAAPESAYVAYAAVHPAGGRLLGWCRVLGAWGERVLARDRAGAEAQLVRAEALAQALERRPGGDATLGDQVRLLRSPAGRRREPELARAHHAFAAGCELEDQGNFRGAAARFAATRNGATGAPVLDAWARLMYGSMVFQNGDTARGLAIFRRAAAEADTVRHAALAARARLLHAAVLLRGDRYVAGLAQAELAVPLFTRAGERENEGTALDAVAIAHFGLRDMDQGYSSVHRALELLRPYRRSYRLHNLLSYTSRQVAADGFPHAALRMQDEGVGVADRIGKPLYVAEIRLDRARLLASSGAFSRAAADVEAAQRVIGRIPPGRAREWAHAQRQTVEAAVLARTDPGRAAAKLDSATEFFLAIGAPLMALDPIVEGARARLAAGDVPRATGRLEAAIRLLENRRNSIRMEPRRAAVFAQAREVVERLAMLRLSAGDTAGALAYLDRGRASLAPAGGMAHAGQLLEPLRAPEGPQVGVAVEYALVGDTLLAWVVEGRQVHLFRSLVDTVHLRRTLDHLLQRLEDLAPEDELRPYLVELHEWLLRPLARYLGPPETPLIIIADGMLGAVPFAALWDARTGRYLVESHPLRYAVSLPEARRMRSPERRMSRALFVSDPAFDWRLHPGVERLPAAAEEVREIAAGYPRPRLLSTAEATTDALRKALGESGLVHYAGHAMFDGERPERSHLLLAAVPGAAGRGELAAGEIAGMDLRHLSLVVLSACQSVRTGPERAAGFSGLAGAFLAAGAGGAVGSLWDVDDRLTRPLMVAFHRAYRASGDAPGALRAAQLQLRTSADPALRSPAAWAGFRYLGS